MTLVPLDPQQHADLCVAPAPDLSHAETLDHAVIGLAEVATAASDYPLVLLKDSQTGRMHLAALLGFGQKLNLYILNGQWHATYIPQTVLRYPFFLDDSAPLGLALENTSKLLGKRGESLFGESGQPSSITRAMAETLGHMMRDRAAMTVFVDELIARKLVRNLHLDLNFKDGSSSQIAGLYTIDQFVLAELDGDALRALNQNGHLAPAHVMMASLQQLNRLEQLYNARSEKRIIRLDFH